MLVMLTMFSMLVVHAVVGAERPLSQLYEGSELDGRSDGQRETLGLMMSRTHGAGEQNDAAAAWRLHEEPSRAGVERSGRCPAGGESLTGSPERKRLEFAGRSEAQCWQIECPQPGTKPLLHFLPLPYTKECSKTSDAASNCLLAIQSGRTCAKDFAPGTEFAGACDTTCGYCVPSANSLRLLDGTDVTSPAIQILPGVSDYRGVVANSHFGAASGKMTVMLNATISLVGVPGENFAAEYWCGAIIRGCTDPASPNFREAATVDDGSCDKADLLAAFAINASDRGESGSLDHPWDLSADICAFTGVGCSLNGRFSGRVASISLQDHQHLVVTLGESSLGRLTNLRALQLQDTAVRGTIPQIFWTTDSCSKCGLTQLIDLQLWASPDNVQTALISGTIPSTIRHTKLISLDVDGTRLSGTLPQLPESIASLYLYDTLFSGTLPASIGRMENLTELSFYNTRISGNLTQIRHLQKLKLLMFYGTMIDGTLPEALGSNADLLTVLGYGTALSGTIPDSLFKLQKLQSIGLQQTQLSGTLPDPSGMKMLAELSLFDTHITGTLPTALGQLLQLKHLYMHNIQLSGAVPDLSNCTQLDTLSLTNTSLTSFPRRLPFSLTHIFLDQNPLNATTAGLCAQELPNLEQMAISFVNVPIVLEPQNPGPRGAWVTPPCCRAGHSCVACNDNSKVSCVVGEECIWLFEMRDASDQPVRTGGIIANLHIGYDCHADTPTSRVDRSSCKKSTLMGDNQNGTFTATVPAEGWIDEAGVKTFRFFHGDKEFQPYMRGDNVRSKYDSLRTVVYAPRVIKCEAYEYDTRKGGVLLCATGMWKKEWQDRLYGDTIPDSSKVCASCPTLCSTCTDGVATLNDGWRLNGDNVQDLKDQILVSNCEEEDHAKCSHKPVVVAFRCPASSQRVTAGVAMYKNNLTETEGCPPLTLDPVAFEGDAESRWMKNSACRGNRRGRLCAKCESGYTMDTSNHECVECPAGDHEDYDQIHHMFRVSKTQLLLIVLVIFAIVVAVLATQKERLKRTWHLIWTNVRICLGLAQVLTLMGDVLDVVYPRKPSTVMHYAGLFAADIRGLLLLDCPGRSFKALDWYGIWTLTAIVVPVVVVSLVLMRYCWHRFCKHTEQNEARTKLVESLFIVILFLYPQVSAKIMSVLRCRELGPDVSVLEVDYSVDCTLKNTKYQHYRCIAILLFVIWPFGIPITLAALLTRQWIRYGRQWEDYENERSSDAPDTATLASQRQHSERADFSKARMIEHYNFCVDHYKPEFWWFEPVDMLRKLALTGLLQFAWRGTAAQVLLGCCLSFASLGMQSFLNPYVEAGSNLLKACAETVLFLTFLIGFVVRTLSPQTRMLEPCAPDCNQYYGWVLISTYLGFMLLAVIITVYEVRQKRNFQTRLLDTTLALPSSWTTPDMHDHSRHSLPEIDLGALTHGSPKQRNLASDTTGLDVDASNQPVVNAPERGDLSDTTRSLNDGDNQRHAPASTGSASDASDESLFEDGSGSPDLPTGTFTVGQAQQPRRATTGTAGSGLSRPTSPGLVGSRAAQAVNVQQRERIIDANENA